MEESTAFQELLSDKLYDTWYRESLLLLASCAGDTMFGELMSWLISDNKYGINDHLCTVMLEERREHSLYAAKKAELRALQEQVRTVLAVVTLLLFGLGV